MRKLLALVLLAAACDPQIYDDKKVEHAPAPAAEPTPGPSPFAALAALDKLKEPGRFDDPKQSKDLDESKPHTAILELDGTVADLGAPFALFGGGGLELRRLVARLRGLDGEAHVEKLILRLGNLSMSAAAMEELGDVIASLELPVHCHVDAAENLEVVLLAACDRVALAPTGVIAITGPAIQPVYLRGLLDLVGVEPDFIPVGAYKGAGEPLMRTEPSPEMKETYDALLDGVYLRMQQRLSKGRKVDEARVKGWFDQGLFGAARAKEAGLVDDIATYPELRSTAGAWKKVELSEKDESLAFMQLLAGQGRKKVAGPHVTVLYAVGQISDGEGSGAAPWGEITAANLVPALREAIADDDVKAIVLRVDSPGGSALASEQIWQEMSAAAKKKVVVVSMGSVAASGGYYIASPARRIFAQPDTITGSIGVIGGKLAIGPALAKIGVNVVDMSRGKRALVGSSNRKWSADERAAILELMTEIYEVFLGHVAEGRKLPRDAVHAIAQGRVWNGFDAQQRKLVDELGGLDDAIAWAAKEAGVPGGSTVEYWPGDPTLKDILGALERSFDLPFGIQAGVWAELPAEAKRLIGLARGFSTGQGIRTVTLIAVP
jgi:protease IV